MSGLSPKDRMAIKRTKMREQGADARAKNFKEVNEGLEELAARQEAKRCLECKNKPCVAGCPVAVRIPEFLVKLADGDLAGAAAILREDNALPATTGRVCPQEKQCEQLCVHGKKGEPVAIGWLERFVADWAARNMEPPKPPAVKTGRRVCVVGSGPGGLTAAGELARMGHDVTIFEALHAAGGVLRYGIPEFRLPKDIVRDEVENLRRMGVEFQTNVVVGRTYTLDDLLREEGYHAALIATGAGLPIFMNIPGEQLCGV